MQLSDKLKLARQQQHLTQTQVAEQLHVSAKTISSWKTHVASPTSEHWSASVTFTTFLWIDYLGRIVQ